MTPKILELTRALEEEVEKRPVTRWLMTHPGVGPLTALAFELVIGTPDRCHCGKQVASYVMARKMAVHLYWMWRQSWDYGQLQKLGSHAGEPGRHC